MMPLEEAASDSEDDTGSDSEGKIHGPGPAAVGSARTGIVLIAVGLVALVALALCQQQPQPGPGGALLGGWPSWPFWNVRAPAHILTFNCTQDTDNHTEFVLCLKQRILALQAEKDIRDLPSEVRARFTEFIVFLRAHRRAYFSGDTVEVAEFRKRLETFAQTARLVDERNAEAWAAWAESESDGNSSASSLGSRMRHGITKFADWTPEEFQAMLGGREESGAAAAARRLWSIWDILEEPDISPKPAPCQRNWASRGEIRNQGACGNCWAFSAVESIRAAAIQQTGRDPGRLSTQYLANCMYQNTKCQGGVDGCCGGNPAQAFQFIAMNGGIPTQEDYGNVFKNGEDAGASDATPGSSAGPTSPAGYGITYTGNFPTRDWPCKQGIPNKVTLTGRLKQLGKEQEMSEYVCKTGSLSVLVDASMWQTYAGGVIDRKACGTDVNHAVVAVGLSKDHDAWIIQNSWGPDWGVGVDGAPAPKDKYANCDRLAGEDLAGCGRSLWLTGEIVRDVCRASCAAPEERSTGGYILTQYGSDACRITAQADVVPTIVELD